LNAETTSQPQECFGDLDRVFPKGPGGVRVVPVSCWACPQRVPCLREAVTKAENKKALNQELASRQEQAQGGLTGFIRRWSRLKSQSRKEEA
jgi:hypothetical protein